MIKFQSTNRYPIALNLTIFVDGMLIDEPYWDKLTHSVKDRLNNGNVSFFFYYFNYQLLKHSTRQCVFRTTNEPIHFLLVS